MTSITLWFLVLTSVLIFSSGCFFFITFPLLVYVVSLQKKKKKKVKIAYKKCRINHICFKQKPFPKIYMHALIFFVSFSTWTWCFLESVCISLPFISFFKKNQMVYVDSHAHCSHVGVNVVCIDAVYKCCIKTSLLLKGTSTYHSSDLIYQQQKGVPLFFFSPEQGLQLRCPERNKNTNGKSFLMDVMTRTCIKYWIMWMEICAPGHWMALR